MQAGTIVLEWSGLVYLNLSQFGEGTKALAMAIADTRCFFYCGGVTTLAAVEKYGI